MISVLTAMIELIAKYSTEGIILALILLVIYLFRIILDEDRSAAWRARVYKEVYKLSGKSKAEKKYIENDINSRINLARRKMPFGREHLPKSIKVEWFEGGDGQTSSIKENEIVIRLDPMETQEKNIILLTEALVKQTSLVGIRYVLDESLEFSMDLNLVKNLLTEIGDRQILDWFLRNEYQPSVEQSEELKEWNEKIVEIDERGLFTRLLLVELDDYSKRIMGKTPSPEMFDEIAGLVDFLYKIAIRKHRQEVPLDYISKNIKTAVIPVGVTSKILSGIERYLLAFAYKMEMQLSSIYVLVWDKEFLSDSAPEAYQKFVDMTEKLDNKIQRTFQVFKDFGPIKYSYIDSDGNKRKAKITRYIPEYGL